MEIGSTLPLDPLRQNGVQPWQQADRSVNKPPAEEPAVAGMSAPQVGATDDVEEKTRRVARLIRQRRDSGFYHRADVLREVVSRLLESNDLARAEINLS